MSVLRQHYCRFCAELKADEDLLDLTVYSYVYQELKDKLYLFNVQNINFTSNDILPKTICFICNTALNNAYEFIIRLKTSQTILNALFVTENVKTEVKTEESLAQENIKSENSSEGESDAYKSNISDVFIHTMSESKQCNNDVIDDDDSVFTYNGVPIFDEDTPVKPRNDNKVKSLKVDNSWTGYPWNCQFCEKSFADINMLREHSKSAHEICCAFRCADCGVKINNFEEIIDHVVNHREPLRNYCQYCNMELDPDNKEEHISKHKKCESICVKCGKIFANKYYLKEHISKFEPTKKPEGIETKPKRKRIWKKPVKPVKIKNTKEKSWANYPWTCQICNNSFGDITTLRTHIQEIHGKCFAMKCVDCDEVMECYRGFVYHVRRHRPYLKEHCHYCNLKFKESEQGTKHVSQHFAESHELCEGCGEIILDREVYLHHVATYDPPQSQLHRSREIPQGFDDLKCEFCGKECKNWRLLRDHRKTHINRKRDYTCDRCGMAFYSSIILKNHYLTHKEGQEVCKICNKTFKLKSKLKQHVLVHTGEKPFQCNVCHRRFRLKSQMAQHSIIHTSEMPYKCQYCDKPFKHKPNLKTHELQHTGVRPYSCSDCGMEFTNWGNCNKHMTSRHGTTLTKKKTPHENTEGNFKFADLEAFKEWTEQVLAPKKGQKDNDNTA